MQGHFFHIEGQWLAIKVEEPDDLLNAHEHESDSDEFVDMNDPRLTSETIEINPEADAFEPVVTVAIQT